MDGRNWKSLRCFDAGPKRTLYRGWGGGGEHQYTKLGREKIKRPNTFATDCRSFIHHPAPHSATEIFLEGAILEVFTELRRISDNLIIIDIQPLVARSTGSVDPHVQNVPVKVTL